MAGTVQRVRRTQEERSAATRAKLLDATIDCLVERGYTRTTTTEVAERSGLSRGAQLHHFPTKAELVEAAVEHLAHRLADGYRTQVAQIPGKANRAEATIDLLWTGAQGPLFTAALELIAVARTDEELRPALERFQHVIRQEMAISFRAIFGDDLDDEDLRTALELTVAFMNGMALDQSPDGDGRRAALVEAWKRLVAPLFGDGTT